MTRYHLLPALALLLSLSACKKDSNPSPINGGSKDSTTNTTFPTGPASPSGSGKKGADFSTNMAYGTWNGDIVALKAFWYYTWGTLLPSPSPQNCEFVSMFWGASNVTLANISAVQQLKVQGKAKYVLGFNEPNRSDQSNMTVSQALALWPQLESIGLPLGSPAASTPSANAYPPDQVLAFMKRLLPKLEGLSFVQHYSWFSGDPKGPQLWSSALIDANGNLTTLGSYYASYQPNTAIAK